MKATHVKLIVADTGPLIALARLDRLELLTTLFSEVHLPQTVLSEATRKSEYAEVEVIHSFAMAHTQVGATIENALSGHLLKILDEGKHRHWLWRRSWTVVY